MNLNSGLEQTPYMFALISVSSALCAVQVYVPYISHSTRTTTFCFLFSYRRCARWADGSSKDKEQVANVNSVRSILYRVGDIQDIVLQHTNHCERTSPEQFHRLLARAVGNPS